MEFVGGGRKVNTAAMMTQHNCLAVDYLVLAVLCIPAQHRGLPSLTIRSPSEVATAEWRGRRGHCHLVISRHTAINTSYFSPGLANWTITRDCVVRREEDYNKLIQLPLLLFLTTD